MMLEKISRQFFIGVLILLISLFSFGKAFSVTEDEKNNIAVYEKGCRWGG